MMIKKFPNLLVLTFIFFLFISPVAAQSADGPIYIVQPGDSLFSIAQRFNISIDELMNVNNITDPDTLSAGQRLIIPGLDGVTGVLDTQIINFGDSFRSLVRRTQVPVDLLRRLNHVVSPTEFYVGASMVVPQQELANNLTSVTPAAGESLLELAIRNDTDPWTVLELNNLAGTWDGVPGDVLYTPGIVEGGQPATGLPPAFKSAQLKGLPLMQGRTAVIFVQTDADVALSGMLITQPLHFFPMPDGSQVALQGVHALLEPGIYPLRLDASLPDGTRQSFEQTVLVVSGNYPEDPLLRVDPSTIDPTVTEPETLRIITAVQEATPQKFWDGLYITPAAQYAESSYFTSRFGNRRTYIGQGTELEIFGFHTGVDFGGGVGLPITAPAAGRVVFTEALTVRGNATIVDHGWGIYSGFWHQSEFKVQVGDIIQQGQVLGLVGGTGRVTGAHLHWELWVNGVQVDPLDWLNQAYP